MEVGSPVMLAVGSPPRVDVENSSVAEASDSLALKPVAELVGIPEDRSEPVEVAIGKIV